MKRLFGILTIISLCVAFTSCMSNRTVLRGNGKRHYTSRKLVRLDVNKDGRISKSEANRKLRRKFDRRDINKDGYVAKNEMVTYWR